MDEATLASRHRAIGPANAPDEARHKPARQTVPMPSLDGLTAVASGGAVLTEAAVVDLQRLAGNGATRSLIQRQPKVQPAAGNQAAEPAPATPVEAWDGAAQGYLKDNPAVYYTLNNTGDQQLEYLLRIHNRGHAAVALETQYEYKTLGEQRAWIAIEAFSGKSEEVTNGLPPHSSLHLRLYGRRDQTQPDQVWVDGSVEVRRTK